ncbi:MAG: acyltransferase [Lapillicoccus sp.]
MTAASPEPARRADIQGLRALAVVGVIAAHLTGWPASGYLGVDVFFVLSGFLITGLLLRERDRTGGTRMGAFYARRARRILPLAVLVLALTVAASAWAFTGPRLDEIRTDALWAALFAANWRFAAVGSDYFALGQSPSPVQHFWSLGVEEQFYLVWPWLVVASGAIGLRRARNPRHTRAAVGAVSLVIVGASLAWAVAHTGADPTTAYYSSMTRAWELGLGAALACLAAAAARLPAAARAALSRAGLAVVVASFVVLGELTPPYPAAVPATLGTVAVLVAGIGRPVASAVLLTNPVSRYLGDISYGLYLWHFPLVVLLPALVPASPAERVLVVLLTLALAATSYHLLERPVLDAPTRDAVAGVGRRASWTAWWVRRRRGILAAGTAAVCLVAVAGAAAAVGPDRLAELAGAAGSSVVSPVAGGALGDPGAAPAPAAPSSGPTVTETPSASPSPSSSPSSSPTTTSGPAPVPLGATGEALQAGLRGALGSGSFPGDLTPKTDQWATTQDTNPAMKACPATVVRDPRSCTFGNPNGPEIDVYGDSLGIPLLAAVVAAYGKDYKIRGLTKIACAVNGADANYGKDAWAMPCVDHRNAVVDYVRKTRPAVLMMIETYAWTTKLKSKATGEAMATEWTAADQAFVDQVRNSVGHVVIVSPSIPGVAFLDCFRPGGSPSRCVTGIPTWWKQAQDAERRVQGATFLDTLLWYCVDNRCPIFTTHHNTVLKGDYLHPAVQYMRLVADDLRYRLATSGVLP